jgi:hypothetical protein
VQESQNGHTNSSALLRHWQFFYRLLWFGGLGTRLFGAPRVVPHNFMELSILLLVISIGASICRTGSTHRADGEGSVSARPGLLHASHEGCGDDVYGGEPWLGAIFSERMSREFGKPRLPRSEIQQRDKDLAASVQLVLEENYFALLNSVQKQTGMRTLCLAGGGSKLCS